MIARVEDTSKCLQLCAYRGDSIQVCLQNGWSWTLTAFRTCFGSFVCGTAINKNNFAK